MQFALRNLALVLKNKDFVFLTIGEAISSFGNRFFKIAFPILIYNLSKSAIALSTMIVIETLPQILFGLFLGVALDRYDRKKIIMYSIVIQTLLVLIIPLLIHVNAHLFFYYVIAFLLSLFGMVYDTSVSVIIPSICAKRDIQVYNSVFQTIRTISKLVGPGLGGLLISIYSISSVLIFDAVTFIVLLLMLIKVTVPQIPLNKSRFKFSELFEGIKTIKKSKVIWSTVILVVFINIAMQAFNASLVYYTKHELYLKDDLVGIIFSFAGLGGIAGGIIAGTLTNKFTPGKILIFSCLLLSGFITCYPFFANWILAGAMYAVISLLVTVMDVTIISTIQQTTNNDILGKVITSINVLTLTISPLGALISGPLTSITSIQTTFVTFGLVTILGVFFSLNKQFLSYKYTDTNTKSV
ncbi:MFS transporter [Thermoflavimicrobium dichotomicum]|uniref:Predicted arabinose efflux permease, MFS family n=1 Tax=Thermoflavimicrobium dichotomicum TaxID=46223 RepID=A0A1I3U6M0_9BACL|nr:MFS transporter [Thermoflavimicrobium dichotomicum]SFJ77437.1 Predicted arabinose efflux permease, MFS family [Thermoflavimicrobium dichotomicum]